MTAITWAIINVLLDAFLVFLNYRFAKKEEGIFLFHIFCMFIAGFVAFGIFDIWTLIKLIF